MWSFKVWIHIEAIQKLSKFSKVQRFVLLPAKVLQNHKLICHSIEVNPVGMYSDQLVSVLLSVLGKKYLFSIWAAKYLAQELSHELSYRDRSYLIFFFYHISSQSSQAIKVVCLYIQEYQPSVWKFNFLLSWTQLKCPRETLFTIVSRMILNSLENIGLSKKSPHEW